MNSTHNTLNIVWKIAIPTIEAASPNISGLKSAFIAIKITKQIAVPITLNIKCTKAALLALLLVPTEDSSAVTHVPIFCPIIIGIAAPYVTCPVDASACRIPTEADDD